MKILLSPEAESTQIAPTAPPGPDSSAATPPAKTEKLNTEQLAGVRKFADRFLGKEVVETPEQKAQREADDAKTKATKAVAPTPAKPKPVVRKQAEQPLTGEQIAEAAARGVATAMQTRPEPGKGAEAKADPPEAKLSAADQDRVKVLRHMEKLQPDKYKDVANRYIAGQLALTAYVSDWEAKHPGEDFDDEAEEHKLFFERNDVDWEDTHFEDARVDMRTSAAVEEKMREVNGRLSQFEKAQKLAESQPLIYAEQTPAARQFWQQSGPEFADVLDDKGALNHAKVAELQKSDPERYNLLVQHATALDAEVAVLYAVMGGLTEFDPKNPVHANVSTFADRQEKAFLAKPEGELQDEKGRLFLPAEKYYKLPKARREESHWTFSVRDLAALRAKELADHAAQIADQQEKSHRQWAQSRGIKLPEKAAPPAEADDSRETEIVDRPDAKPHSPGSAAQSRLAATRSQPDKKDRDANSTFLSRQIHGQS